MVYIGPDMVLVPLPDDECQLSEADMRILFTKEDFIVEVLLCWKLLVYIVSSKQVSSL